MGSNDLPRNPIAGALTYPLRINDNSQAVPIQPRQPRNLQDLLRFCMEATKAEDAPGNSEFGPMDEERRKFLEEALKSLTVDVAEVLQRAIKVLTDQEKMKSIQPYQDLPEDVETAFINILEFVDDIDTANDFYKMGGFAIFPIAYGSENDDVRARASSVLAELCQNNPFCQAKALECGLVNILLNFVQTEKGRALVKCLYALSCATREFDPACKELIAQGGCESLTQVLTDPEPAARIKAAFLIRYLAYHYDEAKERFIKQNIARIIAEQLKKDRDESTEHLLNALMALLDGSDPTLMAQCRDPSFGLKSILENHLKHPDLKTDRFLEEKQYTKLLLTQIFSDCPEVQQPAEEEPADR